jgi:hypothetical protein
MFAGWTFSTENPAVTAEVGRGVLIELERAKTLLPEGDRKHASKKGLLAQTLFRC